MKKLMLFLSAIGLIACENDYYSGDERIIIEGNVMKGDVLLPHVNVNVYPAYTQPKSGVISEIGPENPDGYYSYDSEYNQIGHTKTDSDGKFSLSIPRNKNTHAYIIRIDREQDLKVYGYISDYNVRNYYINLGSLTF